MGSVEEFRGVEGCGGVWRRMLFRNAALTVSGKIWVKRK